MSSLIIPDYFPNEVLQNILKYCEPTIYLENPELLDIWDMTLNKVDFEASLQERYFSQDDTISRSVVLKELFKRAYAIGEEAEFSKLLHGENPCTKIDAWIEEQIRTKSHLKILTRIMEQLNQGDFIKGIEEKSSEEQINQITKWFILDRTPSLSLEKLDLSGANLTELPLELGKWWTPFLRELYLNKNQLREFPPVILELNHLEYVDLQYNQLRELSPKIGLCTSLRVFLRGNQLTTLPPEICKLRYFPEIDGNPIIYLPSQLISIAPDEYKDYFFDLNKDIASLERNFDALPIRLQSLIKRSIYEYIQRYHPEKFDANDPDFGGTLFKQNVPEVNEAINWVKEKLNKLKSLRDSAISAEDEQKKLRILIEMMHYPADKVLFEQQIAEAIIEVVCKLPRNSPLRKEIKEAVAKYPKKKGFEKFTFRPLDPSIRREVTLLGVPQNAAEKSFYNSLTADFEREKLQSILHLFYEKDSGSMITMAIEDLSLETKESIKYWLHLITHGKNGDQIVMDNPKSFDIKEAIRRVIEDLEEW